MDAEIWQTILGILKTKVDETKYKMWIDPLKASINGDQLVIACPNKMMKNYIEKFFFNDIFAAFSSLNIPGSIVLSVYGDKLVAINKTEEFVNKSVINFANKNDQSVNKLPISSEKDQNKIFDQKNINSSSSRSLNDNHIKIYNRGNSSVEDRENNIAFMNSKTFSNFVNGDSNSLACSTAMRIANNPGREFNPLIILGKPGLGKTHLLFALGNEICRLHDDLNVVYVHAPQFLQDLTALLTSNVANKVPQIESLNKFYSEADVLLIDDIQFLAAGPKSQEQIFNIFNILYGNLKQIVITCDTFPKEIKGLEKRLVTRLEQGIITQINVPSFELRINIISSKAREANLVLSSRITEYLAQAFRANVREIEGAINEIKLNCDVQKPPINEPSFELVKEAVKARIQSQERLITPDEVLVKIAETFRIQVKDLKGDKRYRTISYPRNLAMYIVRDVTSMSYPEIGELFGGKHHTTVLTACNKIREGILNDRAMADDYHRIMELLNI